MKYSVVNVKDVRIDNEIFRFDADYFNPLALKTLAQIKKRRFFLIEDDFSVTKLAGFEYTKFFTLENMNSENYYIALTSKNIQNEELNIQEFITIDKNIADTFLKRSKLIPNDVILSYTGEYRRALTLQKYNYQLGPNICLIRPRKNYVKSFYLSTFLNSKYGQLLLDKEKTLSAQPTVAMSRIRRIPIPEYNNNFYILIEKIIKLKSQIKQNVEIIYKNSEKLLLKEINIENWTTKYKLWSVKNYSDVKDANRLDAEYFQPKYDEIINILTKNGYTRLIDNFDIVRNSGLEYHEDGKFGVIKTKQIKDKFIDFNVESKTNLYEDNVIVKNKDVIFASMGVGSLGKANIYYNFENNNKFVIDSTLKIFRKKINGSISPELLETYLHTQIAQELIYQNVVGSSGIISVYESYLQELPIPIINSSMEQKIVENIKTAHLLNYQSKQLLEIAKRGVEIAIEQDEDIATSWINQELQKIGVEL